MMLFGMVLGFVAGSAATLFTFFIATHLRHRHTPEGAPALS